MGNFYANVTLVGTDVESVRSWLLAERREAFLMARGNNVVVFDKQAEQQDGSNQALAQRLSSTFGVALAAVVHDDDLLELHVFDHGDLTDMYNSWPGYHDDDDEDGDKPTPVGGDPDALTSLVGAGDPAAVEEILRGEYLFEVERHEQLLTALNLPVDAAGFGFTYIARSDAAGPEVTRVGR